MADDGNASPQDDIKSKMKAALERKRANEHAGEAHLGTKGKDGHTHGKSGEQQRFQRKSG